MRKGFEVPTPSLYIFSYTMVTCICDWIGITCICVACVSFKNIYCCSDDKGHSPATSVTEGIVTMCTCI